MMSPFRHLVARAYDWGVRTAQSLVVVKLRMTNTHPYLARDITCH